MAAPATAADARKKFRLSMHIKLERGHPVRNDAKRELILEQRNPTLIRID